MMTMDNIFNSFNEWWNERRNSSLYFTYILFLVLWNWKVLFILFIENNVPPHVSNFQYAISLYLPITGQFPLDFLLYKANALLVPALLTFIAIRYLHEVNSWAHRIGVSNYFERRLIYDEKRADFEDKRTDFLKRIAEQKEKQKGYKIDIEEQTTDKEKWQNEFADLIADKNLSFSKAMAKAIDSIYYSRGSFNHGEFGKDLLDLLLSYQIISVQIRDGVGERLEFTQKGENFAKMFTAKARFS